MPILLEEQAFSINALSQLASANYFGYLLGCLLCSSRALSRRLSLHHTVISCALATSLTLFAMSATHWYPLAFLLRFTAGFASAGIMVFGTLCIFQDKVLQIAAPFFFSGVGVGIAIGNEWVNLAHSLSMTSQQMWQGAGVLTLLGCLTLTYRAAQPPTPRTLANVAPNHSNEIDWRVLTLVYGLAGFGYIIAATYLPTLATLDNVFSRHIWTFFGLSAIPSTFFWSRLAQITGTRRALSLNLLCQSIATLFLLSGTTLGLAIAALGVGATFMGTVALVMPLARRIYAPDAVQLVALVTLSYGAGQVIGPLMVTGLSLFQTSLIAATFLAAAALLIFFTMEKSHALRKYKNH